MLLPTAAFPVCSHDVLRIWLAWLRLVIPLLISGWHHNIGLQVSYPRQVLGKSFLVTRKLHEKPHRRIYVQGEHDADCYLLRSCILLFNGKNAHLC